jgi:hypothetical protein
MKRAEVVSKNLNDEEVIVYVVKPDSKALSEARKESNKAFNEALKSGALLRSKIESYMVSQGLWDEEKTRRVVDINKKINESIRTLKKGGIELLEAREIAIDIQNLRSQLNSLLSKQRELDNYSAEAQADNANFRSLAVSCILNEEGKKAFKDLEDYDSKKEEPYVFDACSKLAEIAFDLNTDWEKQLPENKFLVEYGFCDENLRLIDEQGRSVSKEGKLIDDQGRYIDEEGRLVDYNGNLVDENGDPIEEFKPFTKGGEPVIK